MTAHLDAVLRSLRRVAANPQMRRFELAWFIGWTAELSWIIALWVFAFNASGVLAVGLVELIRALPGALLAPALSTLTDRLPRHRVLLGVHLGRALTMGLVALTIASGWSPLIVYALAPLDGLFAVLHRPTNIPLLPALAGSPEDLVAGNVASSTLEGLAVAAGPVIGGILVVTTSQPWWFVAPAIGFWLAALSVSGLRPAPTRRYHPDRSDLLNTLFGGLRALRDYPSAEVMVGLLWSQMLVRGLLKVLVVAAAGTLLRFGQDGVGYLYAAVGAGSLLSALGATIFVGRGRMAPSFAAGMLLLGAPILLIGLIPLPLPAIGLLMVLGLGNATLDVSGATLMQRSIPTAARGRIFGALEAGAMLSTGIGSALAPLLVNAAGASGSLMITGAILPILALLSWRWVSRIDARGVIPQRQLGLLRGVPMLAPLPIDVLEQVASELVAVRYAAGTPIIHQGDPGDRFYIMAEGQADVSVDGLVIAVVTPGGYFGEIALLRDVPRTASVTSRGEVLAYALDRDAFLAAVMGDRQSTRAADEVIEARLAGI